jgi:hypothetical protein
MNFKEKLIGLVRQADDASAEAFMQEYGDCRNMTNGDKISPLVIIYKRNMTELESMQSGREMCDFISNEVTRLNDAAREADVPTDQYDYVGKWLQKMQREMQSKRMQNPMNALMYFTNAVLKGDGLGVAAEKAAKKIVKKIGKTIVNI